MAYLWLLSAAKSPYRVPWLDYQTRSSAHEWLLPAAKSPCSSPWPMNTKPLPKSPHPQLTLLHMLPPCTITKLLCLMDVDYFPSLVVEWCLVPERVRDVKQVPLSESLLSERSSLAMEARVVTGRWQLIMKGTIRLLRLSLVSMLGLVGNGRVVGIKQSVWSRCDHGLPSKGPSTTVPWATISLRRW